MVGTLKTKQCQRPPGQPIRWAWWPAWSGAFLLACWPRWKLTGFDSQSSEGSMMIYAIFLVVGLVFTIFSAVAGHFFGGHDGAVGTGGHAEGGFDHSGVPGISFFSPTVLACFVTAFGAAGFFFNNNTSNPNISVKRAPVYGLLCIIAAPAVFVFYYYVYEQE